MAAVEVAILVFPGHEATNLSNDNYCVVPTQFVRHVSRLDQRLDQTVAKDKVFLSLKDLNHQKVVNHVPSAILHGQLQKKGVGPTQSMSKIKVVKGVCCVNLLSSVQSVQNVPHVVTWEAFDFRNFFNNGYFVSQKQSGFRRFVGITYSATFDNLSHAKVLALYLQS